MGIRVMTTANNHTMDGGNEGMLRTNRLLDAARITHAGSGKDLTEARQAQVGITPKGTIGVVGMYSIDPSSNRSSRYYDARDKWPGLNPLHVTPYNIVTAEQIASLRKIRDASYAHRSEVTVPVAPVPANEKPDELLLFGSRYKVGENVGSLTYTIDRSDLDGIMRSIRVGKQNSDFMVVAIHAHQNSFSCDDRLLDQMIARNESRVSRAHCRVPLGCVRPEKKPRHRGTGASHIPDELAAAPLTHG